MIPEDADGLPVVIRVRAAAGDDTQSGVGT